MRTGLKVSLLLVVVLLFASAVYAKPAITLYTSVPQNIIDSIEKSFEESHPDIDLQIYRAGTSKVLAKLNAEAESGNVQADLIWVADFSVYENLKAQGLLMPYLPPEAAALDKNLYDPSGYYFAARMINVVLGYNTARIKGDMIPKSWSDLINPKLDNRIGMSSPDRSGAFFVTVGAFVNNDELGWDYFREAAKLGAKSDSNTGIAKKVASGEIMMGFVLDYTVREMKEQGSPIELVWPTEGAIAVPSPIAITAATGEVEASKTFLRYVLSQEGQKALASNGFVPIRSDVPSPAGTPDLGKIRFMPVSWEWLRDNYEYVVNEFNSIMQGQ